MPPKKISNGPVVKVNEPWHKPLNTVTSVSKILAAVVFVILPFLGFWLGTQYDVGTSGDALLNQGEPYVANRGDESDEKKLENVPEVKQPSEPVTPTGAPNGALSGKYVASDFKWVIQNKADDSLMGPRQQLSLEVKGTPYVVGGYTGCAAGAGAAATLLPNEITRQMCWSDGAGFDISVFYENGAYVVKERALIETSGNPEPTPVSAFKPKLVVE